MRRQPEPGDLLPIYHHNGDSFLESLEVCRVVEDVADFEAESPAAGDAGDDLFDRLAQAAVRLGEECDEFHIRRDKEFDRLNSTDLCKRRLELPHHRQQPLGWLNREEKLAIE